jgi:hypothetical protein
MRVRATGVPVPRHERGKPPITKTKTVEVPNDSYYRRRLRKGELERVTRSRREGGEE